MTSIILLQELNKIGRLGFNGSGGQGKIGIGEPKLAYHDSCYLGRYNDIFDAPRDLLDIVLTNRIELERQGENSFCCGAGGGGMWVETDPNTRINKERLEQALDKKTEIIATACPYCLIMLEDAISTKGAGEDIQVLDIAEVLEKKI